ncbi:retinol dehydrogenase 11 [Manduca sexta]|uniref:retinol dehydrogenase 11 n=1 Tax=Manduca sexta TaxID=7130 RepID=UPI00188F98B6|nr:retinol dehydrogenase 11 [Manduca sexta]
MCDTTTRLDGKVVVVTGGSSGLGLEAAKNIAKRGARVVIASRNETKLQKAQAEIVNTSGNYNVAYKLLDLGSLKSVRSFVNDMNGEERLDVLINNAGAIGLPDRLTADELNLTMQVNFFGAFLLTFLMLPKLKASAPSRIINGSAASMYIGSIDFNNWNDVGTHTAIQVVASSKLAMVLFNAELAKRLKGTGVTANSFDPFIAPGTDVFFGLPSYLQDVSRIIASLIGQPKEEVGRQLGYLAAAPNLEMVSGEHYKFCGKFPSHWLVNDGVLTKKLWEESKKLVHISPEEDWELGNK